MNRNCSSRNHSTDSCGCNTEIASHFQSISEYLGKWCIFEPLVRVIKYTQLAAINVNKINLHNKTTHKLHKCYKLVIFKVHLSGSGAFSYHWEGFNIKSSRTKQLHVIFSYSHIIEYVIGDINNCYKFFKSALRD